MPPFHAFLVLKHGPGDAYLDALYCLAACVRWSHRLDDKVPSNKAILARMMTVLPPKLPRGGVLEKHLRQAADLYGLAIFRDGHNGWNDLIDPTNPVGTIVIASVVGLPVPGMKEPPDGYRFVLILGVPDGRGRFLIADPHPAMPDMYRVPVGDFFTAWAATATERENPKALMVWRPDR